SPDNALHSSSADARRVEWRRSRSPSGLPPSRAVHGAKPAPTLPRAQIARRQPLRQAAEPVRSALPRPPTEFWIAPTLRKVRLEEEEKVTIPPSADVEGGNRTTYTQVNERVPGYATSLMCG